MASESGSRVVCLVRHSTKKTSTAFGKDAYTLCSCGKPLPELQLTYALPYGANVSDHGVQFTVFSRSATGMRVLLYDHVDDREPVQTIELDRNCDRWGDV